MTWVTTWAQTGCRGLQGSLLRWPPARASREMQDMRCANSQRPGRGPNRHETTSQYSGLHTWLLLGALPEHAGIALERHKRLAGIDPVLLLLEGDVIDRLTASAALKEGARNVDHVP